MSLARITGDTRDCTLRLNIGQLNGFDDNDFIEYGKICGTINDNADADSYDVKNAVAKALGFDNFESAEAHEQQLIQLVIDEASENAEEGAMDIRDAIIQVLERYDSETDGSMGDIHNDKYSISALHKMGYDGVGMCNNVYGSATEEFRLAIKNATPQELYNMATIGNVLGTALTTAVLRQWVEAAVITAMTEKEIVLTPEAYEAILNSFNAQADVTPTVQDISILMNIFNTELTKMGHGTFFTNPAVTSVANNDINNSEKI